MTDAAPTVVQVSPHPDDELLGAGATLTMLRDRGWSVVNLAAGLGRPADHDRRRAELLEAGRRLRIETEVMNPPLAISRGDDREQATEHLAEHLAGRLHDPRVALVVGPWPEDGHHGHEAVGQAIAEALEKLGRPLPWWGWGLWADLPKPNLYVPFDGPVLREVAHALDAYVGECARNGYQELWPARSTANAVLGSERVFGFGAGRASSLPYAELFMESRYVDGEWRTSPPRSFDPIDPLGTAR